MLKPDDSLDFATLQNRYRAAELKPSDVAAGVLQRISNYPSDNPLWITLLPEQNIMRLAQELDQLSPEDLPLYGIPFAVKDNIDVAGYPTTAACPDYAYTPDYTASVVIRLLKAGAILIGKTNLDQFATGLVGTRSPYGACRNAINPDYISGGSSSGSAVAVAAGLVSFSLGTDTAGSGRVPAAFNNIIGLKPSCGLLSTHGVVPACRSLDCVSVFTLTSADACTVLQCAKGFDPIDSFSRPEADRVIAQPTKPPSKFRFGVPADEHLQFFDNNAAEGLFLSSIQHLKELGGEPVTIDFAPFLETARLLYEGPWVAERYAAVQSFIEQKPESLHPVTRQIISGADHFNAVDAFQAYYRLRELQRQVEPVWQQIDVLLTPTAGTIYTLAELEQEPVLYNSNLGYYTNFMNLLDMCAVAVPGGFLDDGLPFGITLAAPAFSETLLFSLADPMHRMATVPLGAGTTRLLRPSFDGINNAASSLSPGTVRVAVCGAHMSGLPLNHELSSRDARLLRATHTAAAYRLFALTDFEPVRPGMIKAESGYAIEVEVWEMPEENFGSFINGIPAPLGIGTVELEDGEQVRGFLCEHYATLNASDISELGSWRVFLQS